MRRPDKPNFAVSLTLLASLSLSFGLSCSSKKSSDDTETTEESTAQSASEPGVSTGFATEGVAALVGVLQLPASLRLTAGTLKLYAFPLVGGELPGEADKVEIPLAADGTFEAKLPRVPPILEKLKATKKADGSYDRVKIGEIVGEELDDSVTDQMIADFLAETEAKAKTRGVSWVLASVVETGDKVADGAAMKFISLGNAEKSLSAFPAGKLKGDLSLGTITISENSSEAYASLPLSSDVFDISSDILDAMAKLNDTSKAIRNVYVNGRSLSPTPFYLWYLNNVQNLDDFPSAESIQSKYNGSGMYVSVRLPDLTFGDICSDTAKLVELVPPSGEVDAGMYGKISATRPFNNANRTAIQSESSRYNCVGSDTGFYGASRNSDADYLTQTELMMNWGTGGSITGTIPAGLWQFKVDSTVRGAFDFASGAPFGADGSPKVFIPTLKLLKDDAGNITDAQVKVYTKTAAGWTALSDLSQFKDTVSTFMLELEHREGMSSSGNAFDLLKDGSEAAGVISHDLSKVAPERDDELSNWQTFGGTAASGTQVLTGASVYYEIYGASYRFEFRAQ